jgi:predicted small lipoprotein YifL
MKRPGWLLAGGAALLLAGCGQKGALYLPDKNAAQVVTTPPAQSTPAPSTPASAAPRKPADQNDDSQTPK